MKRTQTRCTKLTVGQFHWQNKNKTAVVKYIQDLNQTVDWDNCRILHFETNFIKQKFLGSYFIHLNDNCVNKKENGYFSHLQ